MLPRHLCLTRSADFARTVKQGRRVGTKNMVVYLVKHTTREGLVRQGGPRFGLIVSKAVGNAVVRHRVSRRLRHLCVGIAEQLSADCDIVIRALPSSAEADSDRLRGDLARAVEKLGRSA